MNFDELIINRQSCRNFDRERAVSDEDIKLILDAARLSPSACNGQPYKFTVCKGETAKEVAVACGGMGMNKFVPDAPVLIVVSEESYVASAALGAKLKKNDYRSIDIGIAASYITLKATDIGLSTCILGWFDNDKIAEICSLSYPVRLVIALGYAKAYDKLRVKKRKDYSQLVSEKQ